MVTNRSLSNLRRWRPGQSGNPHGRPKGSGDWALRLRDEALEALKRCGGVEYLVEQARKRPNAFLQFLAKFLPKDMRISGEEDLGINIIIRKTYRSPKVGVNQGMSASANSEGGRQPGEPSL